MKNRRLLSVLMMTMAAMIWGSSFTAQITGMQYIGPFTFCAVRYTIAAVTMALFTTFIDRKEIASCGMSGVLSRWRKTLKGGMLCGCALFVAGSFQQVGLLFTTGGKAAFITALYLVLVPIYGLFFKRIPSKSILFAVALSVVGLYLLSIKEDFTVGPGDALVFAGAFFWAAHIMLCDHFVSGLEPLRLSTLQFSTVAALSAAVMFAYEVPYIDAIVASWKPIIYAGTLGSCVAYTLQLASQRDISPSATCVIGSAETLFAALFGFLLLGEVLTPRETAGAAILLAATLIAQICEARGSGEKRA